MYKPIWNGLYILLITLFMLSFNLVLFTETDRLLQINGRLQYIPVAIEEFYTVTGHNLATAWVVGIQKQHHTLGLGIEGNFYQLNHHTETMDLEGTQLKLGASINHQYQLHPALVVRWGLGGFWLQESLAAQAVNNMGLCFQNSLCWPICSWLQLEADSQLDMITALGSDSRFGHFALAYTGGIQIHINPGIEWLNLFLSARGLYWNYDYQGLTIDQPMFHLGAGVALDTAFPLPQAVKPEPTATPRPTTPSVTPVPTPTPTPAPDPGLAGLQSAQVGDIIGFFDLHFQERGTELLPSSFFLLNEIVQILQARPGLVVSLSVYSLYSDDPEADFNLYRDRTRLVKQYLVDQGIASLRLEINPEGYLLIRDDENEPKLLIEVLAM